VGRGARPGRTHRLVTYQLLRRPVVPTVAATAGVTAIDWALDGQRAPQRIGGGMDGVLPEVWRYRSGVVPHRPSRSSWRRSR
jgi:hypothetical protein